MRVSTIYQFFFVQVVASLHILVHSESFPVIAAKDVFSNTWIAYDRSLSTFPLVTKCGTSAFGFLIGDVVAQLGSNKLNKLPIFQLDIKRLLSMTAFGLCFHGPFCHYLFQFLEETFPGKEMGVIILKLLIDQAIFAPPFNALFLTYMGLVNGHNPGSIISSIKRNLPTAVLTSWKVWPLVQILNYMYIPLSFRVLFVNCIQIFYSVFLSTIGNENLSKEDNKP